MPDGRRRPLARIPMASFRIIIGLLAAIRAYFHIAAFMDGEHLDHCDDVRRLAANALPWMCLSFARIVQSPHSDAEIFALPELIDYAEVKQRYITGSTMLFIGW